MRFGHLMHNEMNKNYVNNYVIRAISILIKF